MDTTLLDNALKRFHENKRTTKLDVLSNDLAKLTGLGEYEAKAYLALVTLGKRSTAREISDLSTIPRSKIYDILESLSSHGYVHDTGQIDSKHGKSPKTFSPVPLDIAIGSLRQRYEKELEEFKRNAANIVNKVNESIDTYHHGGREFLIKELMDLGFSNYQAKAYAALIFSRDYLSGKEISDIAGIPRTKIYVTMEELEARKAIEPPRRGKVVPTNRILNGNHVQSETVNERMSYFKSIDVRELLDSMIEEYQHAVERAVKFSRDLEDKTRDITKDELHLPDQNAITINPHSPTPYMKKPKGVLKSLRKDGVVPESDISTNSSDEVKKDVDSHRDKTLVDKAIEITEENPWIPFDELTKRLYADKAIDNPDAYRKRAAAILASARKIKDIKVSTQLTVKAEIEDLFKENPTATFDDVVKTIYLSRRPNASKNAVLWTKQYVRELIKDGKIPDIEIPNKRKSVRTIPKEIEKYLDSLKEEFVSGRRTGPVDFNDFARDMFIGNGWADDMETAVRKAEHYLYKMFPPRNGMKRPRASIVKKDNVYVDMKTERDGKIMELLSQVGLNGESVEYAMGLSDKLGVPTTKRRSLIESDAATIVYASALNTGRNDITQRAIADIAGVDHLTISRRFGFIKEKLNLDLKSTKSGPRKPREETVRAQHEAKFTRDAVILDIVSELDFHERAAKFSRKISDALGVPRKRVYDPTELGLAILKIASDRYSLGFRSRDLAKLRQADAASIQKIAEKLKRNPAVKKLL